MAVYLPRTVVRSTPSLPSHLLSDFTFRMLTRSYKSHPERFSPDDLLDRLHPFPIRQLHSFIIQLLSSVSASKTVVMASLVYHNRLRTFHSNWIQRQPINLVYMTCLMLAFKFIEDQPVYARSWSSASGLSLASINEMERIVLGKFTFNIHITESTIQCYLHQANQFYCYQRNLLSSPYPKLSLDRRLSQPRLFREDSYGWSIPPQTKPEIPWSQIGPPPGITLIPNETGFYPSLPLPQWNEFGTDFIHAIPYYSPHFSLPL